MMHQGAGRQSDHRTRRQQSAGISLSEARAGAWLASGRVAPGLAQAVFLIIAARVAGADVLGVLAVGTVTAQWLGIISDFGSGDMLLLRVGQGRRLADFAGPVARSKIVVGAAIVAVSAVIAALLGQPYGAVVAAGGVFGTALGTTQPLTASLILLGRAATESAVAWVEAIATVAVGSILLVLGLEPWTVIVSFAAVRWLGNTARFRLAQPLRDASAPWSGRRTAPESRSAGRRRGPQRPGAEPPLTWQVVLRDGVPFVVFLACLVTFFQVDVVILAALASPAAVGVYQVAWRLVYFPGTIGESLILILLPRLAGEGDRGIAGQLRAVMPAFALIGTALAGVLWISAPWLTGTLFGPEFDQAAELMRILLWGVPIRFANYGLEVVLTASGRLGRRLVAAGSYTGIGTAVMIVGAGLAGAPGLAAARVLGEVTVGLSYLLALRGVTLRDSGGTVVDDADPAGP